MPQQEQLEAEHILLGRLTWTEHQEEMDLQEHPGQAGRQELRAHQDKMVHRELLVKMVRVVLLEHLVHQVLLEHLVLTDKMDNHHLYSYTKRKLILILVILEIHMCYGTMLLKLEQQLFISIT